MGNSGFFALMSRMKYINRWALMRNTRSENLCDHSLETAMLAHMLGVIRNVRFGGNCDPERIALLAIYHDSTEILTGDLPTPIKYYSADIKEAYKDVELAAKEQLLSYLPDDLRDVYKPLLSKTDEEADSWTLVKAADKLSALIKCVEERHMGNVDFRAAELSTLEAIHKMNVPEAEVFIKEFLPSYDLTLDEQA